MSQIRSTFLLLLLAAATMFAQLNGRLTGSVVDPSGASVPGAQVNILLPGGTAPLLTMKTNSEGLFDFVAVRPDTYVLVVEIQGFAKYTMADLKIDPARTTSLPPVRLQLTASSQTVEVSANAGTVDTSSAEISTTVSQSQIQNLPVLDRQISYIFQTQAGVGSNTRTATVINGMRPSYSNLTLDGINFQDTVRTNDLDYLANKFTVAQVAEFTVATSNASPTIGGAASTVAMRTPSGTNDIHGSVYWYNRNSYFAANDWFNNKNGVVRPHNNLNEIGGTVGGPIRKDKLFYFGNYEAFRLKRQSTVNNTILLPDARNGILTYKVGGVNQKFDVMKAAGLSMSPAIQKLLAQVPTVGNNNSIGDGLNTTGYSFSARYNETRDNITGKVDYNLSVRNVFAGSFIWNRDNVDRPGYTPFYTFIPPIYNDNNAKLMSASWRWTPSATLTNELRGGFNLAPGTFKNRQTNPSYFITGMNFSSPIESGEVSEGRTVNAYVLQDNANWARGKHSISFGYQMTLLEQPLYGYNGAVPSYGLGISGASPYGFTTQIAGATSTDYSRANALLATFAGLLSTGTQTYNPTSRTSGFVPGAPSKYDQNFNQYAFYALDSLKLRRNLTRL